MDVSRQATKEQMYAVHTLRLALEPLLQVASVCPFAVLDPPPPTLCLFLPFFAMAHVRTLETREQKLVGCSNSLRDSNSLNFFPV